MKKSIIALSICLLANTTVFAVSDEIKDQFTLPEQGSITKKGPEPFQVLDGLHGSMTITSNYVFRGNTQSNNLPAFQSSIIYLAPYGIYGSLWGSNASFTDTDTRVELDTLLGARGSLYDEFFKYDINYVRYNYPRARVLEYNEFNTLFNLSFLQAGLSYSGNVYNSHKPGTYFNGGINYNIPQKYVYVSDLNITALLGRYVLHQVAGRSYNDYSVSLTKQLTDIFSLSFLWAGTGGQVDNTTYYILSANANF